MSYVSVDLLAAMGGVYLSRCLRRAWPAVWDAMACMDLMMEVTFASAILVTLDSFIGFWDALVRATIEGLSC